MEREKEFADICVQATGLCVYMCKFERRYTKAHLENRIGKREKDRVVRKEHGMRGNQPLRVLKKSFQSVVTGGRVALAEEYCKKGKANAKEYKLTQEKSK